MVEVYDTELYDGDAMLALVAPPLPPPNSGLRFIA